MKTLVVYGSSDNIITATGIPGGNEFYSSNPNNNNAIQAALSVGGKVVILALYWNGVWSFSISQIDENVPLPADWAIRLAPHRNGYSMEVQMDVPDDTALSEIKLNG